MILASCPVVPTLRNVGLVPFAGSNLPLPLRYVVCVRHRAAEEGEVTLPCDPPGGTDRLGSGAALGGRALGDGPALPAILRKLWVLEDLKFTSHKHVRSGNS